MEKEERRREGSRQKGVKFPRISSVYTLHPGLLHHSYSCTGDACLGGCLIGAPARPRAGSHSPHGLMSSSPVIPEASEVNEGQQARQNGVVDGECGTHTNNFLNELDDVQNDLEDSNCSSSSAHLESSTLSTGSTTSDVIPAETEFLGHSPSAPLPASFISDMKLFRKNVEGESILHVLAHQGHSQLLGIVLKVAERLKHALDEELTVLTQRDGFTLRTPIEEGLMVGNLECVRLLIEFAGNTNLMKRLFEDDDLMKVAVLFDQDNSTTNVEALKMLIGFGFKLGLAKSITLADLKEHRDMTRLLLYYQTQVVNSTEYATVHPNHTVSLKVGHINWEGFNLRHIEGEWLRDANGAVDSVSRIFNDPEYKVHKSFRFTQKFFRRLGAKCLSYFSIAAIPSTPERTYSFIVPVVEMNLSENHLTSVPPELFQQPHLRTLKLSHNELKELPTSGTIHKTLYSCPKLHKLELDWNQLQLLPEEFCWGVGKSLVELSLVHNELTELPPGLWVMRKLTKLKLNKNKLTHLHTFSQAQYFDNVELTRRVVMLFKASPSGELEIAEGGDVMKDKEVLYKVKRYLTQLISFLKTVLVMLDKDDPTTNLAQAVIDVHWRRYNESDNTGHIPRTACTCFIDTCFDSVEDEDGTSLIQTGFSSLQELHLDDNCFQELPWDLPCIAPKLHKLYLRENRITDLDIVHGPPSNTVTLCLSKNRITTTMKMRSASLPCASPLFLLSMQAERAMCANYCTHCQRTRLDSLGNLTLDHNQLTKFDLVNVSNDLLVEELSQNLATYTNIEIELLFPKITVLNLSYNQLKQVPQNIEKLTSLSSLYLSGNTAITELPEELGRMNPQVFLSLFLDGLFIKNVPQNILESKSARDIICYLKAIREK